MSKEVLGENLENKNVFVTGASKGLGEQIALGLLEKGAFIIGASRSGPPESFQPYIDQEQASYELGDLSSDGDRILSDVHKKHNGFEVFVNNAGAFSSDYLTHIDASKVSSEIELDVIAPLLLHREWFRYYNQQHPEVRAPELSINICSISSFYAWPGGTAYQAAKSGMAAAVYGLRSMQRYLKDQASDEVRQQIGPSADLKTRFVAIYPDNVATGLISNAQQDSLYEVQGDRLPTEIVTETVMKAIEGKGNFGKYEDIAILANPNDPDSGRQLRGAYLAFIPIDEETGRPNFSKRILEKLANEETLIKEEP